MRSEFLPFARPSIDDAEIDEVVDTLRTGWVTTGPKTRRFEEEFADFLGAPAALAVGSCTVAMHAALVCHGLGPGDEVITSTFTFAATANVIEHVGARPVLVDVEPDTLNIDPEGIEAALTGRTRAILPVHFAGHPAEMDAIRDLADAKKLHLIEDAAHALPAKYRGTVVGAANNLAAFSFYATKNLTTGEGGMLTGDPDLLEQARIVSLHGMSKSAWKRYEAAGSWYYEVVLPGFKYNMTDVQASLGLQQLRKLPAFQRRREELVATYDDAFAGEEALELPARRPHVEHAWHLYVLRLRSDALDIDRARFVEELKKRNVGSSVHFIPLHLHPFYREKYGLEPEDFPNALDSYNRCLSLPLHPGLSDEDARDVVEAVLSIVDEYRR